MVINTNNIIHYVRAYVYQVLRDYRHSCENLKNDDEPSCLFAGSDFSVNSILPPLLPEICKSMRVSRKSFLGCVFCGGVDLMEELGRYYDGIVCMIYVP